MRHAARHPLFDLLTGGAYVHLYYIFILVQFVLLADFFCIAMQRHPRRLMLCAAAATFGMQLLLACQANGMLMFHAPLSLVRLFFGWTLFYTGGHLAAPAREMAALPALRERTGVAALGARGAADKPYVPLAQRILAASRPSGLRLCDVAHAVDAVQPVPDTSGARALYRPAFLRPVPRSSMVLRLWNVWTTHHDPVIYLRLPQMYLLGFGGGLAAAVLLSFLPFGTLLGGAHRKKRSRTGDL